MSRQLPINKAVGLFTAPNDISGVPSGAFSKLDNCIIRVADVIEPRRGQPVDGTAGFGTSESLGNAISYLSGSLVIQYGTGSLAYQNGTAWTTYSGTFTPPDSASLRMKFARAQERLYFTTSSGVYRADTISTTPVRAGQWRPNADYAVSKLDTDSAGFMAADRAVAYRDLLVSRDAGGREIVGAPSDRLVIVNPSMSTYAIGALSRTGTTVTATSTAAHGFKVGDVVTMNSAGEVNFVAGQKTVVSVTGSLVWTYTEAGAATTNGTQQTFQFGASRVSRRSTLPTGVTAGQVFRSFRSRTTTAATIAPSDDMYLTYEAQVTSTDVSNGYVSFNDNTPDVMLGPIGYFSPSGEGILEANERPLWAKDVTTFNDTLFMGNIRDVHRQEIDLLATGGSAGVTIGTTLVITRGSSNFTITFAATHDATTGTSAVYTGGTVASDIERTALTLVSCINAYASNTIVNARYISTSDDAPGHILLEARDFDTTSFTIVCSGKPLAWSPTLPSSPTTASTQSLAPNRVMWSKPGQADAVPALHFQDVGDADDAILRVMALRDKVLIIKERSVWVGPGAYPFFDFDLLDNTVRFIGPDTCCVLNNTVHALTTQGACVVSDSGVGLISLPIEVDLAKLVATVDDIGALAFGVACETDRLWYLALPLIDGDTSARQMYAWNGLLKAWVGRSLVSRRHAVTEPESDLLWLLDANSNVPRKENRNMQSRDFAGDNESISISNAAELYTFAEVGEIFVAPFTAGSYPTNGPISGSSSLPQYEMIRDVSQTLEIGDIIGNATAGVYATVLGSVGGGFYWVSKKTVYDYPTAATMTFSSLVSVVKVTGVESVIEWTAANYDSAASEKQLQEVVVQYKKKEGTQKLYVASNVSPAFVEAATMTFPGYGEDVFGTDPFGAPEGPDNVRCPVPTQCQRGEYHRIQIRAEQPWRWWKIQGITLCFEGGSERTKR